MRTVKAGYEVFEIPEASNRMEVLMFLERIGRLCYKSEDKITEDSCLEFVQKIRNRKHWAMLEHYIFTFSVPRAVWECITNPNWLSIDNVDLIAALRFISPTYWPNATDEKMKYLVSGSATAFNNLWKCEGFEGAPNAGIPQIAHVMEHLVPELMLDPWHKTSYLNPEIQVLSRAEVTSLPHKLRSIHDFLTVFFNVDRGVTHELVRHRPASWAQESTRYCNYSKGKHGNEITVINPLFYEPGSKAYLVWEDAMEYAEKAYMTLTDKEGINSPAQEARSVLPQSTKAEIIMTAPLMEYQHFFKMRVPVSAHPQMREVTVPFFGQTKGEIPVIFDEIEG